MPCESTPVLLLPLGRWLTLSPTCRYKKRQAEEEAARDAHQQAKAAKRPPPADDSSVFD